MRRIILFSRVVNYSIYGAGDGGGSVSASLLVHTESESAEEERGRDGGRSEFNWLPLQLY